MPHLLVAITAHGYGHLAQTAEVLNLLKQRLPELQLTLYTEVPRQMLGARIDGDFDVVAAAPDVGMLMHDALTVDTAASAAAYRNFHANWHGDLAAEAERLRGLAIDAVFANAPYRVLAAAQRADIPGVALCSLNWADLYRHYCGERPEAAIILEQITAAYRAASVFLQPAPSMPMPTLANGRAISSIARIGRLRRAELVARCGAAPADKLVLISLGGIAIRLDVGRWPRQPGLRWIVPAHWHVLRDDVTAFEDLGLNFVDVLRSVDALITKPGYGSFVEAACNGVPVLYLPRNDWPEALYLERWLARHGRSASIDQIQLERGEVLEPLQALLAAPPPVPPAAEGAAQAADHLLEVLLRAMKKNPDATRQADPT